jgi:hypothetical protein
LERLVELEMRELYSLLSSTRDLCVACRDSCN